LFINTSPLPQSLADRQSESLDAAQSKLNGVGVASTASAWRRHPDAEREPITRSLM
jgi:hypothetical protein